MTPEDSAIPMQAPTLHQLNRATLFAVAGAAAILVVAVLPAEYGIDPTGLGGALGLTPMGEMKRAEAALEDAEAQAAPVAVAEALPPAPPAASPAPTAAEPGAATPAPAAPSQPAAAKLAAVLPTTATPAAARPAPAPAAPAEQSGEVALTLAPNQGREVKALMKAGDGFRYEWKTDGAEVRFELHGERLGASEAFTSYEKGVATGASGNFTAPFDGTHGWYWRNRTDKPVTITVKATGKFQRFAPVE